MEGKSSTRDFFNSCIREGPNSRCADCGASEPQWASANLGIFVCISCSGAHRTLGTHISRVRSLFLDTWQDEEVKIMRELGNAKGNAIWEANLPPFYVRPTPEDSNLFKEQFIKAKYERKEFVDGSHKGLDSSSLPSKDGYLVKKGEVVKNWKKRWFVLHGSLLCYFKKPPGKDDPPAGEILLSEASACDATNDLSVLDNHHNCFEIKTPLRNYYISAESPRVMFEWIQAIRQARYRLAQGITIPGSLKPDEIKVRVSYDASAYRSKVEEVLETLRKSPTLLHRKHSIEKKAFRDCFLGVELTDAIMVHWRLGRRDEASQVAQKVFATGQVLSLNGPAEFVDGRFCYQLKKP